VPRPVRWSSTVATEGRPGSAVFDPMSLEGSSYPMNELGVVSPHVCTTRTFLAHTSTRNQTNFLDRDPRGRHRSEAAGRRGGSLMTARTAGLPAFGTRDWYPPPSIRQSRQRHFWPSDRAAPPAFAGRTVRRATHNRPSLLLPYLHSFLDQLAENRRRSYRPKGGRWLMGRES
jgi:hypothetical protein